jgi:hypothetical protein
MGKQHQPVFAAETMSAIVAKAKRLLKHVRCLTRRRCATLQQRSYPSAWETSMNIKNTALTGLIVALVLVSGCNHKGAMMEPGPGHKHGVDPDRSFRIYIYGDPTQPGQCLVDWPQALLWASKHQTAKWVSDDGAAYTVDFSLGKKGSPFSKPTPTFPVPANGEVPSGDLIGGPGYYDYGIRDANNNICKQASDPGVYVK